MNMENKSSSQFANIEARDQLFRQVLFLNSNFNFHLSSHHLKIVMLYFYELHEHYFPSGTLKFQGIKLSNCDLYLAVVKICALNLIRQDNFEATCRMRLVLECYCEIDMISIISDLQLYLIKKMRQSNLHL